MLLRKLEKKTRPWGAQSQSDTSVMMKQEDLGMFLFVFAACGT